MALFPILGSSSPNLTFYLAVAAASVWCGTGPGLLAAIASALFANLFIAPLFGQPDHVLLEVVRLFVAFITYVGIAVIGGIAHNARESARQESRSVREAAASVREREAHYRLLFDRNPDGVFAMDATGRFILANRACEQICGYTRAELLSKTFMELCPADALGETLARFRRTLSDHQYSELETTIIRKDGKRVDLWVTGEAIVTANGPVVVHCTARDITQRKVMETAYRTTQAALRGILEAASEECIWVFDRDGVVRLVNPAALRHWGRSEEEVIGRPVTDLMSDELAQGRLAKLREVIETGRPVQFEDERDGIIFHHSFIPVPNPQGHGRWVATISRDVTTQRRTAEALRKSEERFRRIFENAATGIAIADWEGHLLQFNPAYCALLVYTEQELQDMPIGQLVHPKDRDEYLAQIQRLRAGEVSSFETENRYLRKDGGTVWTHKFISTLPDETGKPAYLIALVTDITEERRIKEELRSAKQAAEAAKEVAEAASRAKDDFLAVLSHELRNPLNPVLTTASLLLQDSRLGADTHEQLEVICRNAEIEARLIDDLLDVTRITRGKTELHREPIELHAIIDRAIEVCKPDIEARELQFGADGDRCPYWVNADATRLQQVFWNLLKNAVKFTPHGGCIGIRCRKDDDHVVVEVADSGQGIEPEVLPRLFNAFEQGGRPTTRQFGGLGLGLTISKAMVELHGGTIAASSPGKGRGTTFTIRLPLIPAPAAPHGCPSCRENPGTEPSARGLSILLVEDHGDTARVMQRLLNAEGHQVKLAADVATALHMAESAPYDLILSDLGLPDGNGLDLLRNLRSKGITVPAIALSGYGQERDLQQTREAGFSEHLLKPVNIGALRAAIERVAMQHSA